MALGRIGVLDLSIITDRLIALLNNARDTSPLFQDNGGPIQRFSINVSGSMPEAVRADGGCQLSLYLYHVSQDKNQRNTPIPGARATQQPDHPLSLELYYLLSAFAGKDYVQEQQAMSIAMKAFHENPFVRTTVTIEGTPVAEEFVLSMEVEAADKLGFQWQAFSTAFRLSAIYRVAVTFLTPPVTLPAAAPKPQRVGLVAEPSALPFTTGGQILGTERMVTYLSPSSTPANPDARSFDQSPAVVAPGQGFHVWGAGLNQPTSSRVFLLLPNGTEQEVTAWKAAASEQTTSRVTLTLPAALGALPGGSPAPGLYQLRLGDATFRTNATPFSVAASVAVGANPPLLPAVGGLFTLTGAGFIAGNTELLLGAARLQEVAGPPAAGEFQINGSQTAITFAAPAGLAAGRYPIRLRVNNIESAPSWWVDL
jgi:hypothetical protein